MGRLNFFSHKSDVFVACHNAKRWFTLLGVRTSGIACISLGELECRFENEETADLVFLTISLTSSHKSMVARQAAVQTPEAEPVLRAKQLLDVGLCPRPIYSVHDTHKAGCRYAAPMSNGRRLIESSASSTRTHRAMVTPYGGRASP